jgi:uncharacterized membrane protein YphA (DoxX/SURF4 family)
MNAMLWILQVVLAAAFLAHGLMFLFPPADLVAVMNASLSKPLRYFLGVAEVAAAFGLVVPGLTRIQPWLVAAAAAGLVPIMIGATVLHVVRGEYGSAVTTTVLLLLVALVAWMRSRVHPIAPRRRVLAHG